ncbi:hypothetical protein C8Q77DRAFT_1081934 [Trametes polyzona]|nr:hypothetical protein C8Q77DRAFT_1081934 [Trametes polyzona]
MSSLRERLVSVESEFLSALSEGENSMTQFEGRLIAILDDVDRALASNTLDSETATLAHLVSWRCATLADTSIELFSSCDSLTSLLMVQIDGLMAELSIEDVPEVTQRFSSPNCPAPLSSSKRMRDGHEEDYPTRTYKRHRSSGHANPALALPERAHVPPFSSKISTPFAPLTSPSSTTRLDNSLSPVPLPSTFSPSVPHQPPTSVRKRRRSESDDLTPSKRLYAGPRLHAVSDSFVNISSLPGAPKRNEERVASSLSPPDGLLDIRSLSSSATDVAIPQRPDPWECAFDIPVLQGCAEFGQSPSVVDSSPYVLEPLFDPSWSPAAFDFVPQHTGGLDGSHSTLASSSLPLSPAPSPSAICYWASSPSTSGSSSPSTPRSSPSAQHVTLVEPADQSDSFATLDEWLSVFAVPSPEKTSMSTCESYSPLIVEDAQGASDWISVFDLLNAPRVSEGDHLEQPRGHGSYDICVDTRVLATTPPERNLVSPPS